MTTEAEIYKDLTTIFHDVLMRDDLQLTSDLSAPQVKDWDSFKHVEILLASEEHWAIRFSSREIDSMRTVGDLAQMILKKLNPA